MTAIVPFGNRQERIAGRYSIDATACRAFIAKQIVLADKAVAEVVAARARLQ